VSECSGSGHTEYCSCRDGAEVLAKDHDQDARRTRAQGQSYSDFASTLRDVVRGHSVDTDASKQQRQRAEHSSYGSRYVDTSKHVRECIDVRRGIDEETAVLLARKGR
jgi:hypothetical protein